MSAPTITRDDAAKIRANLERNGRPIPDALKDATADASPAGVGGGQAVKPPAKAEPAKGRTVVKPTSRAAAKPAARTPEPKVPAAGPRGAAGRVKSSGRARSNGRPARQRSYVAARVRRFAKNPSGLGGDGGGVILALWLYPLVLAIVQEGTAGPGQWLRAKFLNVQGTPPAGSKWQAATPSTGGGGAAAAPPKPPAGVGGQFGDPVKPSQTPGKGGGMF